MTNTEEQLQILRNTFCESADGIRLAYLMYEIDGFAHVKKDRFDYAIEEVERREAQNDIPNPNAMPDLYDELNGFRKMLDCAIAGGDK